MNNTYFSNNGLTSTEANFIANLCKELQQSLIAQLNGIKFYQTEITLLGSKDRQTMCYGTDSIDFIKENLQKSSELNALCAWLREALREKDRQIQYIEYFTFDDWLKQQNVVQPDCKEKPESLTPCTEEEILQTWDVEKLNKYFTLEAFAATFGKYIHPDGVYNNARKDLHSVINNPITKEGVGRDTVLKINSPSINPNSVDTLFFEMQTEHRKYEQELNQLKSELKIEANKITKLREEKLEDDWIEYNNSVENIRNFKEKMQNTYRAWKIKELERISKLKIVIPPSLKDTLETVKKYGNTSK